MREADLWLAPGLPPGEAALWAAPLALVDLSAWPAAAAIGALPACPVIGVGAADHPLSAQLDVVVEAPVSLGSLVGAVSRAPGAAMALVGLLRGLDGVPVPRALALESMAFAMLQGSAEHRGWLAARPPAAAEPPGTLHIARDGDVLNLLIDRPWARNAIDRPMRDALHEAFTLAALDPSIATVRLRGAGAAFSVGADLAEFGTTRDPLTAHAVRMRTLPAVALARFAGRFEAHAHGACVGSALELAAFAARFTAGPDAWFHLPELAMGIIPGAGGCVSVARRIGRQRAALMILSGRRVSARVGLRWGLIDAIVDDPPGHHREADQR